MWFWVWEDINNNDLSVTGIVKSISYSVLQSALNTDTIVDVPWSNYLWLVFEFGPYSNVERTIVVSKHYINNTTSSTRIIFTDNYYLNSVLKTQTIIIYKNDNNSLYLRTSGDLRNEFRVNIYAFIKAH